MSSKPIWNKAVTVHEINERSQNTLMSHMGILFTEIGNDFLVATMPVEAKTMQPMGILHGGASCALAETVGSAAANYCVDPQKYLCVGLDININHIRSVQSGTVTGIAKPLHLGKTTHVWEIKIYTEDKKLVSAARLTVAVLTKNPPK